MLGDAKEKTRAVGKRIVHHARDISRFVGCPLSAIETDGKPLNAIEDFGQFR